MEKKIKAVTWVINKESRSTWKNEKYLLFFSNQTVVNPDSFKQKGIIAPGICYTNEQQQKREKDPIVSFKTK